MKAEHENIFYVVSWWQLGGASEREAIKLKEFLLLFRPGIDRRLFSLKEISECGCWSVDGGKSRGDGSEVGSSGRIFHILISGFLARYELAS